MPQTRGRWPIFLKRNRVLTIKICVQADWDLFSAAFVASENNCIDKLRSRVNSETLCSLASSLRRHQNGAGDGDTISCTADLSRETLRSMMGGQNCHADIMFQGGVKWVARFRLIASGSSPPREIRDYILRSEAATLAYFGHTAIPVPSVFDWACESDPANPLGVGYILMEKLDGKALDWSTLTGMQREKIMQQLADIFLEIEKHPFNAMGSLVQTTADEFGVQGLASHHATFLVGDGKGPLGPFSSSLEGSRAIIQSYLAMAASGEVDITHSVDAYLAYRFRLELARNLWVEGGVGPHRQQFFLKHTDDKGDHIFVNDAFDIIGIIDWEWARTVSKAEAFCAPSMMWPVADFYSGSNELATDELRLASILQERGREDLASCVTDGRRFQRFFFALGPSSAFLERRAFIGLCSGLKRALDPKDEGGWEEWRAKALKMWEEDSLLQKALCLENEERGMVVQSACS